MNRTWITFGTVAGLAAAAVSLPMVASTAGAATATNTPTLTIGRLAGAVVSPTAYADQLVRAWGRGDRPRVDALATAAVARALFTYSTPGGVTWRRIAWEGAAGTMFVTYHDDARGGTMTVGVSDVILSEGREHAAYTVRFSQPHPIGPAAYADRLVRAWGRGDHVATGAYATAAVARVLFAHADPGGSQWRRIAADGAAGTTYVTYQDDRGTRLVLGVGNAAEQDGRWHAVYEARFNR